MMDADIISDALRRAGCRALEELTPAQLEELAANLDAAANFHRQHANELRHFRRQQTEEP